MDDFDDNSLSSRVFIRTCNMLLLLIRSFIRVNNVYAILSQLK